MSEEEELDNILAEFSACLDNPNKVARKKSVEKLLQYVTTSHPANELTRIFTNTYKQLITCISDSSERVRETSGNVIIYLVSNLTPDITSLCLVYLLPSVRQRLSQEDGEEVRLVLINMIKAVISRYTNDFMSPYITTIVDIITTSLQDKNPDIIVTACSICSLLCTLHPTAAKLQAGSLISHLLAVSSHKLMRVRVAGMSSLVPVVMVTGQVSESLVSCLTNGLSDTSPRVRLETCRTVFTCLTVESDYKSNLLALGMAGLQDQSSEVSTVVKVLWSEIGNKNCDDGESCSDIVRVNKNKLLEIIGLQIQDWRTTERCVGYQMLCSLLDYILDPEIDCLDQVLNYLATGSKEEECIYFVKSCCILLSESLPSKVMSQPIINLVESDPSHDMLIVVAMILETSPSTPDPRIVNVLTSNPMVDNTETQFQLTLLSCLKSLLSPTSPGQNDIFLVLHTVLAMTSSGQVKQLARDIIQSILSKEDMYNMEINKMLTRHLHAITPKQVKVMSAILQEAGPLGLLQSIDFLISFLRNYLVNPERDPELCKVLLEMLDQLLARHILDLTNPSRLEYILREIIIPVTVWRTGLIQQQLRCLACRCLYHLVSQDTSDGVRNNKEISGVIRNRLFDLVKDQGMETRKVACSTLEVLIREELDQCVVDTIVDELVGRLDDSVADVRNEAVRVVAIICKGSHGNRIKKKLRIDGDHSKDVMQLVKQMTKL